MEICPELNVEYLADGNGREWSRLMDVYSDMVLEHARRFIKDYHSAQDVHQNVFIKLWSQRSLFRELRSVKGYLIRMTKHTALSFRRNADKEQTTCVLTEHLEMIYLGEDEEPTRILENAQVQETINHIHSALTPSQKRIFADFIDDPDPDTPIVKRAKRLRCSPQNIRATLERIRANHQHRPILRERHDLR